MKTIELTEQERVLIEHFLVEIANPLTSRYSKTTQKVAQNIINKLDKEVTNG